MKLTIGVLFLCCTAIVVAADEELKTRIANKGEIAKDGEFPYQVSIQKDRDHFCGGSLISKTHVLTAAHCVQPGVDMGRFPFHISVEVGSARLGQGKTHEVKRVSYLRGFQMQSSLFLPKDVAVIHLTEPVELSDKVKIIDLPSADSSLPVGTKVIASGFGVDDADWGQISPILKKMDAKVVSHAECQQPLMPRLHVGKMCAAKGAGYGTCKGDSGGPLVDESKTTIIGIVSGGDGKCKKGTPDVYTEVSRFLPYINEELNWKPGTPSQNPAINYDNQSGTGPQVPPLPPTQPPSAWPWRPQPCIPTSQSNQWIVWGPESQKFKNPINPLSPFRPTNPWNSQQGLQPCPPGWKPQNPSNPMQPFPQQPLKPQQPFPQQPWKPQQPFPQQPLKPQQPYPNPQLPWNPHKPWNPQNPFPQQPSTQKPQMPPSQKPHYPWLPQQPHNPFQPQDPLDPSNPDLEESISA